MHRLVDWSAGMYMQPPATGSVASQACVLGSETIGLISLYNLLRPHTGFPGQDVWRCSGDCVEFGPAGCWAVIHHDWHIHGAVRHARLPEPPGADSLVFFWMTYV